MYLLCRDYMSKKNTYFLNSELLKKSLPSKGLRRQTVLKASASVIMPAIEKLPNWERQLSQISRACRIQKSRQPHMSRQQDSQNMSAYSPVILYHSDPYCFTMMITAYKKQKPQFPCSIVTVTPYSFWASEINCGQVIQFIIEYLTR